MKRQLLPNNTLIAPVTPENIAEKLWKQHKIKVDASQIKSQNLTELGERNVKINIADVDVDLKVNITKR
jgi:ribosomal protein L9